MAGAAGAFRPAAFRHSQSLEAEDVLRTKVVAGRSARVGIALEGYDVERPRETWFRSIAYVSLFIGSTIIGSDISEDGERHFHPLQTVCLAPRTCSGRMTWIWPWICMMLRSLPPPKLAS